jgi:hypothetical protein
MGIADKSSTVYNHSLFVSIPRPTMHSGIGAEKAELFGNVIIPQHRRNYPVNFRFSGPKSGAAKPFGAAVHCPGSRFIASFLFPDGAIWRYQFRPTRMGRPQEGE